MATQDASDGSDNRPGAEGAVKPTLKIDPTSKQVIGREIGGYRIQSELGRGGMAMVYRALDPALDRTVAVKILPQHLLQEDEEFAQRFEREARAAARLDHPNVVQVYSAGRSDGILYIAMQFVEGSPLSDVMRSRRVEMRETLDLVRQAARGLEAAHKLGIVHRDIKPSNIMVDLEGRVKVMDFGLAKAHATGTAITRTGTYLGTPEYSSPEQCETREVDARSDLYSLGVILYELLSGALPHFAETPLALFKKITEERPIPIQDLNRSVPKSVRMLLEQMLAKDPQKRIQSAAEVAASLERILKTEKLPALPRQDGKSKDLPAISGRIPVGRRRQSRMAAGFAALALGGAGVLLGGMYYSQDRTERVPDPVKVADAPPPRNEPSLPHVVVKDQVVVFDFQNGDPKGAGAREHEWLEVGITEMLIADLSQGGDSEVMLRDDLVHSMRELLHRKVALEGGAPAVDAPGGDKVPLNEDSRRLVTELKARWLVSGVFYAKDQLRIVAKLYRLGEDEVLSAVAPLQVSGDMSNVFSLVDDLAAKVLERIPHHRPPSPDSNFDGRNTQSEATNAAGLTEPLLDRLRMAQSKSYVMNNFARQQVESPKTVPPTVGDKFGVLADEKSLKKSGDSSDPDALALGGGGSSGAAVPQVTSASPGGVKEPDRGGKGAKDDAAADEVKKVAVVDQEKLDLERKEKEGGQKQEEALKAPLRGRRWVAGAGKLQSKSADLIRKLAQRLKPEAATAEDPLERYQVYCEARIHLEEMPSDDASTARDQAKRLSEIFSQGLSIDETLEQLEGLLEEVESVKSPESATEEKK